MRLWLSFATVLVLFLCINGDHIPLEPCPDTSACLIFGNDICTVNGVQTGAYVWHKDKSKTMCQNVNYGYVYARLDIHPYTPSKWKFLATFYEKYNSGIGQKIESLVFNFGKAKMQILSKAKLRFTWNGEVSEHEMKSEGTFTSIDPSRTISFTFGRYSFEIGVKGKKLIDFIGPNVSLDYDGAEASRGTIGNFAPQLDNLTPCDPFEIRHVCKGSCDKLTILEPKIVVCPSKMWFTKNEATGGWNETNRLECKLGSWMFASGGESLKVDSTVAFQCSAVKPEPPITTTTAAPQPSSARVGVILGSAIGGVVGLIIVAVGVFFLVRFCRRRGGDKKTTKGVSSIRIRDVPSRRVEGARTPADKMPEYTAQTDFEGLRTEILEETTATAKFGEEPPVQDAGTPLGTARPSPVPTPSPAGTPSVVAVATAELTPAL